MGNSAKLYAQVLGAVLLLVGALGFIPALAPDGNLLGIFAIDGPHNVVHILSGVVGLAAGFAAGSRYARLYALVFGIVYAGVTIVGFIQGTTVLGIIPINLADNLLHMLIAVSALGVYVASSTPSAVPARA
ncbi:MAG TPA: DUF4383 domain-containing protein [Ktedonobacterales bacterium]|nr:DUF4383 domain-containing protein [Ktedonobacterales bacterium]